jgi:hypothetical protein
MHFLFRMLQWIFFSYGTPAVTRENLLTSFDVELHSGSCAHINDNRSC